MSQRRKDSITGKVNVIGKFAEWGKKHTKKALFRGTSATSLQAPPDELDDIELLEDIVHDLVDFDWEGLEVEKKSLYHKRMAQQQKQLRRSQFKEMFLDGGAVQSWDVNTDEEMSEVESSPSASILHRARSEDCINKISNEGKSKLKFIMQFANSGNTLAAKQTLMNLSQKDRVRLRNSIHHARLSKLYKTKPRRRSTIQSLQSTRSRGSNNSLIHRRNHQYSQDSFAKLKGFRNKAHMEKSMERIRGFEELKEDTQIRLMALGNGYKPANTVIDVLDLDNEAVSPIEDFSDSEDDAEMEEINEFMEMGDDDLEKLMDKWDAENDYESQSDDEDTVRPRVKSKEEAVKLKLQRRQRAIRNGWETKQKEKTNQFAKFRVQPKDSLSARHFEMFAEEAV